MGEYADMILEGLLDEQTGELIDGEAPGYPRSKYKRLPLPAKVPDDYPWECPCCNKRLKSEQGVRDHMRAKHGVS